MKNTDLEKAFEKKVDTRKGYSVTYTRGIYVGPSDSGDNGIPRTTIVWAESREEARTIFLNNHKTLPYANQMYYVLSVSMEGK